MSKSVNFAVDHCFTPRRKSENPRMLARGIRDIFRSIKPSWRLTSISNLKVFATNRFELPKQIKHTLLFKLAKKKTNFIGMKSELCIRERLSFTSPNYIKYPHSHDSPQCSHKNSSVPNSSKTSKRANPPCHNLPAHLQTPEHRSMTENVCIRHYRICALKVPYEVASLSVWISFD